MDYSNIVKKAFSKHGERSKLSTIFKELAATGTKVSPAGSATKMPKVPSPASPKAPKAPAQPGPIKTTMPDSMDGVDLRPGGLHGVMGNL